MLCALTVRKLKPGAMEGFKQAFIPDENMEAPPGWKRFYAIRNVADESEDGIFEVVEDHSME
jgi:hypothetical protein